MRRISAAEAATLVRDGDTLLIGGSGGGHAVPDALLEAIGARFRGGAGPWGLTALHPVGLGDGKTRGAGHLAQEGLLKRVVSGTFVNSPGIARLALDDKIEAYTLPQGSLSQLTREMAAGRPGLMTRIGLHSFVDPRLEGGRQSACAPALVQLVAFQGEEYLFYPSFAVDVALIRGSAADEDGNISMEHEAVTLEMLSIAQAARRSGGLVIAQVKTIVGRGTLHPKMVKVPGILVDAVVEVPGQWQTFETQDSAAYSGHVRVALEEIPRLPAGPRRVVARRGAMELFEGAICNLGSGISTGIANVAAEEGVLRRVCLTNEQGNVGGAPASGNEAGAARSPDAQIDQPYQFDFYDGGGLDLAFLSFAEFDAAGNVNVSRFGGRIVGPGGFVNISQGAKAVIFGGTLTANGAAKAVARVEQVTFSGPFARERGQSVLYVTERAVFRLGDAGPELIEVAPGCDVERDVIGVMGFRPRVSPGLRRMDAALFAEGAMGLSSRLPAGLRRAALERLARVAA